MGKIHAISEREVPAPATGAVDLKLEVVILPVADADRAKDFYTGLGWRLDADIIAGDQFRVLQVTPPGSRCSVVFGKGVTSAAPGSAPGFYLIVSDLEAARADLISHGVEVSEPFHRVGNEAQVAGPDPQGRSYFTFASFKDPDGNTWLLQEIKKRLPGRVKKDETGFASVTELAGALKRAEAAHGKHEARTGKKDPDWPSWYAEYMVREQTGEEPPT
jgi:catechol 2,3-dioxygenase-like lactoylglutathione lyase family enzyme